MWVLLGVVEVVLVVVEEVWLDCVEWSVDIVVVVD